MNRLAALMLAAGLAGCAETPPASAPAAGPVAEAEAVVQPGVVCHVGPDGGPVVDDSAGGDRAAGSGRAPRPGLSEAERGIGGAGTPGQIADRGIGGTGIVGVVTGFASVCVDGLEVRYDGSVPVDINGTAATAGQLRVGQVVVVRATESAPGPSGGSLQPPKAQAISVRTEVSGPIEAVELGSGAVMVAGQRVVIPATAWGASRFGLGDWAAVSGLRQADGTILASRLDPATPGALLVRGPVSKDGGAPRIGSLTLAGEATNGLHAGDFVTVSGGYTRGAATVSAVTPDALSADPVAYFGPSVNHVVVQAFVRVEHGAVWLNNHLKVPAATGVPAQAAASGDAVVSLRRAADGTVTATELRYTRYRAESRDSTAAATAKAVVTSVSVPLTRAPGPLPVANAAGAKTAGSAANPPPTPAPAVAPVVPVSVDVVPPAPAAVAPPAPAASSPPTEISPPAPPLTSQAAPPAPAVTSVAASPVVTTRSPAAPVSVTTATVTTTPVTPSVAAPAAVVSPQQVTPTSPVTKPTLTTPPVATPPVATPQGLGPPVVVSSCSGPCGSPPLATSPVSMLAAARFHGLPGLLNNGTIVKGTPTAGVVPPVVNPPAGSMIGTGTKTGQRGGRAVH